MPFVSDRWGVEVRWFHDKSSHAFPNSNVLPVCTTFSLCDGSKNFDKLTSVWCEDFVLHGLDWIHWVARSFITTAYWSLSLESRPSLRTLWSAVIKSPNFFARGRASPVRLLQGALFILVREQTSQFRSLGKWVEILCFLDLVTTFVGRTESESWELCADAGNSVPSRLFVNSSNHSRRSCKRSSESRLPPLFLFLFWVLEGDPLQFPGVT